LLEEALEPFVADLERHVDSSAWRSRRWRTRRG
jgi:hypothetical protein